MNYWTFVQLSVEELEELVEADLPPDLRMKLSETYAAACAHVEKIELAKHDRERRAWNAEMEQLLGTDLS